MLPTVKDTMLVKSCNNEIHKLLKINCLDMKSVGESEYASAEQEIVAIWQLDYGKFR